MFSQLKEKMKNNIMKCLALAVVSFALASCSDYLEERSQDTYYVSSYKDLDELLLGDCYAAVNRSTDLTSTSDIGYFIHYLGDEIEEQNGDMYDYGDGIREKVFGYYTWQQRTGETYNKQGYQTENDTWETVYRYINVANNIIESVSRVPQNTDDERLGAMRVNGEAHFLRAYYYFWLANLYGKPYTAATAATDLAVPIKTDAKVNDVIYQRNTVAEVYNQVLADLDVAEQLLSQTGKAKSVYRADIIAVYFLKSRVYLYMQNWELAASYAQKVLDNRSGLVDYNTLQGAPLSKGSVETIFSMGGDAIPCSMDNIYQCFRVSHDLYEAYGDDDLRKSKCWWTYNNFVGYTKIAGASSAETPTDDESYYNDHYYYGLNGSMAEVSDRFLFRTAEAYLIKAEADAYLGNESEARQLLNTLRQHRFKTGSNYEITASGQELVEDIRNERRLELALEGSRWFDLRRYSVCDHYPESKQKTHIYSIYRSRFRISEHRQYVLQPNDPAYTLPIPNEVIEFNTGMVNNERPERTYTVVSND